jgi:hypothetical protein
VMKLTLTLEFFDREQREHGNKEAKHGFPLFPVLDLFPADNGNMENEREQNNLGFTLLFPCSRCSRSRIADERSKS